jgi:hypothetical protein
MKNHSLSVLFVVIAASTTFISPAPATLLSYDALIASDNGGALPYETISTSSLSFDGNNGADFDFGSISGSATMEFIVAGDAAAGGRDGFLGVGSNATFSLRYEQWDDTGQLGFTHGGVADYTFDPPVTSPATQTHIAYQWHEPTSTMSMYIDGSLAGTATASGFEMPTGAGSLGNSAELSEGMLGTIDRVTVYNSALDPAFITAHAAAWLMPETDPYIPLDLPGPGAGPGAWGVREITNNGVIGSLRDAAVSAAGGGTIVDGQFARLDVTDPDTNPDGGPIISTAPQNFLSNTGGDDDNITTVARGRILVPEGQGGDYTFQMNANDGIALRVVGQEFSEASGGFVDVIDSSSVVNLSAGTSFGVVNLDPGEYDLELLTYENQDEAFYELTSAQGAHTNVATAQWLAVGDNSTLPGFTLLPTILMTDPATVLNGTAVTVEEGVAAVRQKLLLDGNFTALGESSIVALHDPESGDDLNGTSTPFPGGVDGTDDDDFTTAVLGTFLLDDGDEIAGEDIDLTFAIRSDDNGQFHIVGADFDPDGLFGDAQTAAVDVGGDLACTGDFPSPNINAVCQITLAEGDYGFEGFHVEFGGGAYYQVYWADGLKTAFGSDFTILAVDDVGTEIPENNGLALVGGVDLVPGDANGDGTVDALDLNTLGVNWQQNVAGGIAEGDFDESGFVDAADLNILGTNWLFGVGEGAAAVPEPNAVALTLAGLLGLLTLRRRRR